MRGREKDRKRERTKNIQYIIKHLLLLNSNIAEMKFLSNLNYQILVCPQLASEPLIKTKMRIITRNDVCYRELHQIPCLELIYHHSTPDLVLTLKGIHMIYCTCVYMYTVQSLCTCTCTFTLYMYSTFILYMYSSFIQCTCVHVHSYCTCTFILYMYSSFIQCTCVHVHSYCTCTFILYMYSSFIQCTCVHVHSYCTRTCT